MNIKIPIHRLASLLLAHCQIFTTDIVFFFSVLKDALIYFGLVIANSHLYPLIWQSMNPCDIPRTNHDPQVFSNQWMIDVCALLRNWNIPTSYHVCQHGDSLYNLSGRYGQESKYFFLRCSSELLYSS